MTLSPYAIGFHPGLSSAERCLARSDEGGELGKADDGKTVSEWGKRTWNRRSLPSRLR
ncbi:hypothetical protein C2845_PM04G21430 [Panicum miliaceum]|uniref:Uncharacterized protein n=1 Tax=Panicum miliaceum TaxID=4540 RepID=A0A3L6QP28_PANMI|nr:hypothetical protein C2845_PM04G21430 [Panicum miliaceum]